MIRSLDPGRVNLGLCDFCPVENKICRWDVFAAQSIEALFSALEARPFEGRVVIERQSKKSMKMLAVQHWLQAFYVMKGNPVTIFSPVHKLAGSGQENAGRGNYRARKKAAVAITTEWLREHPQEPDIEKFFKDSKKKDDAADSWLMAQAYLKRSPVVSQLPVEPTKIVCRQPTLMQQKTGRYSKSNIKHLITKSWQCKDEASMREHLLTDKKVATSIQKLFGTVDVCCNTLGLFRL